MQQQQEDEEFDVKRNLIVNYLPQTFTQDEVSQMFARIGPVSNCKLIRNYTTGQSLGYAFIEYPTAQLAEDAINQLDGMTLQDKKLKVSYARPSSTEIKNSNVYVAGLPSWVDEDRLLSLFAPFGSIITHKILTDAASKSRGVGFVRYSLKSDAEKAIESMAGKVLPDSTTALIVKLAIPPASKQLAAAAAAAQPLNSIAGVPKQIVQYNPMSLSNPVYVYGLQPHHSELTLYELFAPFGGILNVKLIRDNAKPEKPCKGYGFVNFRKQDEALAAIATMHNHPYDGKILQVSFKQNKQLGQATAMNLLMHQGVASTPIPQNNISVGMNYGYGAVGQGVYR